MQHALKLQSLGSAFLHREMAKFVLLHKLTQATCSLSLSGGTRANRAMELCWPLLPLLEVLAFFFMVDLGNNKVLYRKKCG